MRRRNDEDEEETKTDDLEAEKLEELKEIQKLKKRVNRGVNVTDLLNSDKNKRVVSKPTKEEVGGMTDARTLMSSELDLGNTFSAETNRRDEDADMMKYIEQELAKRKGTAEENETAHPTAATSDDMVFNGLPQHLLFSNKKSSEEMLSNQMLSGIPEIDLGVDERIRNIEATEEAKVKLLQNRHKRNRDSSSATLVPTNIAVNFVQHNRYSVAESEPVLAAPKKPRMVKPVVTVVEEPVVVIGDEPRQGKFKNYPTNPHNYVKFPGKEKATDDYHFERFRKQFRK